MSVSFPVVKSALLHVTLMLLVKILHHVPLIIPVTIIAQVAHHARLFITKLLGLAVVKFVGYTSVIVRSPVSGPLFPYVIVYWISSPL